MVRTAICPGSFDPVTRGHLDIISRAAGLFDRVVAAVIYNPDKARAFTFSIEERVDFLKRVTADMPNVEVGSHAGLLAEYARELGACALVKGLRAVSDFEYEFQMALANKQLNPELETVFLTTSSKYLYLSSSMVKQIGSLGGDVSEFLPAEILNDVAARLTGRG